MGLKMTLTEQDLPALREIIREVIAQAAPTIAERAAWHVAEKVIKRHVDTCPVRWELRLTFWRTVAMLFAAGGAGGGVVKLLPW
jgi:hypothetical protein